MIVQRSAPILKEVQVWPWLASHAHNAFRLTIVDVIRGTILLTMRRLCRHRARILSGTGPNGEGMDQFPSQDAVVKAVSGLENAVVMDYPDAAAGCIKQQPASNGTLAINVYDVHILW